MNHIILPHNQVIDIPAQVAVCPYCGGPLYVQLDSWTQDDDDGTWKADEDCTHAVCATEPDGADYDTPQEFKRAWEDWFEHHSKMPYVYQMPVDMKVTKWINEHYRFDMNT